MAGADTPIATWSWSQSSRFTIEVYPWLNEQMKSQHKRILVWGFPVRGHYMSSTGMFSKQTIKLVQLSVRCIRYHPEVHLCVSSIRLPRRWLQVFQPGKGVIQIHGQRRDIGAISSSRGESKSVRARHRQREPFKFL
jgi:hypothetical protein